MDEKSFSELCQEIKQDLQEVKILLLDFFDSQATEEERGDLQEIQELEGKWDTISIIVIRTDLSERGRSKFQKKRLERRDRKATYFLKKMMRRGGRGESQSTKIIKNVKRKIKRGQGGRYEIKGKRKKKRLRVGRGNFKEKG